jgi:hypothetical protein
VCVFNGREESLPLDDDVACHLRRPTLEDRARQARKTPDRSSASPRSYYLHYMRRPEPVRLKCRPHVASLSHTFRLFSLKNIPFLFGESGLFENEPTDPQSRHTPPRAAVLPPLLLLPPPQSPGSHTLNSSHWALAWDAGSAFFAKVVIEINTNGRQQNGAHDKHGGSDF